MCYNVHAVWNNLCMDGGYFMINKERILAEFFELVQITCNSRQEREIGDLMKKRLQDLGGEVIEDGAGAIIGGNCTTFIIKKTFVRNLFRTSMHNNILAIDFVGTQGREKYTNN